MFGCFASQVVSRLGTTVSLRLWDRTECQIKEVGGGAGHAVVQHLHIWKIYPHPARFSTLRVSIWRNCDLCLSLLAMELGGTLLLCT